MKIHESGEMYLETIYILSQKSKSVRGVDIGEYMGYSKPSVSRGVNILKKDGLVFVDALGNIVLSKKGEDIAKRIYERHTVLSKTLMLLGVSEEKASEDACRMEHYMSEETFEAIKNYFNKIEK